MFDLPLFPLNIVLFPGMPLNLHIFEPRYRLMVRACIERNQPFGVALIRQGLEALGPPAVPYSTGSTARIVQVERLDDGRMNIVVVGDERFCILGIDSSREYLVGQVESCPMENPTALEVLRGGRKLRAMVRAYYQALARLSQEEPDLSEVELPDDSYGLLYMAAALLQIPAVEKQHLLEAKTAAHMLHQLERLYRREIALHRAPGEDEQARRSSWLN